MKYNEAKIQECADYIRENGLMEHGGATLAEYCRDMDIDTETHRRWLNKAEYADAIKRAKEEFRGKLEKNIVTSMAQAATGYEYEETSTEFINRDGVPVPRKTLKTKKRAQPNVAAGIFLLTNIAPERWKNKMNTEHSGQVETGITFVVKDEEQAKKLEELKDL